ncbi:hypothetical protein QBZ16_000745 [Prototheca wickerhamii]|uniref:Exostosin GT47 domain-containing protein n=1 Tax=Prototheca wickerhamii TaxID=3111 RepID=A0AAD9INC2_PROWI|nr:hypothetical protein QBZ16_000745 [Prototheca wickerhamii]
MPGHGECSLGFCKCHEGWFGHDCAYRMQAVVDGPGLEESRPWLRAHVETPASHDPAPGATRLRPLIWVYEMPTDYNSLLLQYRVARHYGAPRLFIDGNDSVPMDVEVYGLEFTLHEMLLQSPHRTLDPEEADFFYVPVYTNMVIIPVTGWTDGPYYYSPVQYRTMHATSFLDEAQHWIQSHYPYWDRKGGRDHIWLVTHDEGSCWVPNSIRPSHILSHWGRMDENHTAWTHYDLIVPALHSPNTYVKSPLLGAPAQNRTYLAIFKGRMQRIAKRAWEEDWEHKHRILIVDNTNKTEKSYSELMASSIFCLAIIVRFSFDDAERLPELLKAIPESEILRKQRNIRKVWKRYSWSSLKWFRQIAREKLTANWALNPEDETNSTEIPERQRPYDPASGDAFQTLMEWLYGQMEKSEGG